MKHLLLTILPLATVCFTSYAASAQSYPEMIAVAGDTFKMGKEPGLDMNEDRTSHKVILSSFKIAKTEVTVAQWKKYCEETATPMPPAPTWGWKDDNPIVNISWDDAVSYCEWLSTETGRKYRLPTEAEWEFAARGGQAGKGYKYSGGRGMDMLGWSYENSGGSTHAVATKRANELGLYDMCGNVYEWCADRFGSYPSRTAVNPKGPNAGYMRVYRGGSWYTAAEYCTVANRESNNPKETFNFVGFRPVEEGDSKAEQAVYAVQPKN